MGKAFVFGMYGLIGCGVILLLGAVAVVIRDWFTGKRH